MFPSDRETSRLVVEAQDRCIEIAVLDAKLKPVTDEPQLGRMVVDLRPGIYAIEFRTGDAVKKVLREIEDSGEEIELRLGERDTLAFTTAVPLIDTASYRLAHDKAARSVSIGDVVFPHGVNDESTSELMLFVRSVSGEEFETHPLAGISLLDASGRLVTETWPHAQSSFDESWAGCRIGLAPGFYRLRLAAHRGTAERPPLDLPIYAFSCRQTRIFCLYDNCDLAEGNPLPVRLSLQISGCGDAFSSDDSIARLTESALIALAEERAVVAGASTSVNSEKQPMLCILRALLELRRPDCDVAAVHTSYQSLRRLLGAQADVLAIGWGLAGRELPASLRRALLADLRRSGRVNTPPMLVESWRQLLRATAVEKSLIPVDSLASRIASSAVEAGPWLHWLADAEPLEPELALALALEDELASAGSWIQERTRGLIGWLKQAWNDLQRQALTRTLSSLQQALNRQHSGELLRYSNISDEQRRIAYFLNPMLEPGIGKLAQHSDSVRESLMQATDLEALAPAEVLERLGLPFLKALGYAKSLQLRIASQPLKPSSAQILAFIAVESRGDARLRSMLSAERLSVSRCCYGEQTLNALEVLHLCYRNLLPGRFEQAPSLDFVVDVMTRHGYRMHGAPPHPDSLRGQIAESRARIMDRLQKAADEGELELLESLDRVLPDPSEAAFGELLPRVKSVNSREAVKS